MLPGFRFLLAAIALSMSVMIFGLGATALLRAAHQEFASTPSWQPAPETRFAQQDMPVLAMVHVEPAANEAKAPDQTVVVSVPADPATAAVSPEVTSGDAASGKTADVKPESSALSEPAFSGDKLAASTDTAPLATASPALATPDSTVALLASAPAPAADVIKIASSNEAPANLDAAKTPVDATETTPPAADSTATPSVAAAPAPPAQLALLTPTATVTAQPKAKVASTQPNKAAIRKRLEARRALARRRIAARARQAAARQAQTPADPFATPATVTPAR